MVDQAFVLATRAYASYGSAPAVSWLTERLGRRALKRADSGAKVQAIQTRRLQDTVRYAYRHSSFYRELFDRAGIDPATIRTLDDLRQAPLTSSRDIRAWRRFLCVPEDKIGGVFATAGSTGQPKEVVFSFRDMQLLTNLGAAMLRFKHSGRVVAHLAFPMASGFWIGGAMAKRVVERAGGLALPVGEEDPEVALWWMRRFNPTMLCSSPAYLTLLTRHAEQVGFRPRLNYLVLGGAALTPERHAQISEYWRAPILNSYGTTELGGVHASILPGMTAFTFNGFMVITEIVDPETGEPADEGELVFTTLRREAMPLIRYRSGDLARWSDEATSLPFRPIQLLGRADDLLLVGGIRPYASLIADAVARVPGATGRLAIRIDKVGVADRLELQVEGCGVSQDQVRQALAASDSGPYYAAAIERGNLILEIRPDADLGTQVKSLRILDERSNSPAVELAPARS